MWEKKRILVLSTPAQWDGARLSIAAVLKVRGAGIGICACATHLAAQRKCESGECKTAN